MQLLVAGAYGRWLTCLSSSIVCRWARIVGPQPVGADRWQQEVGTADAPLMGSTPSGTTGPILALVGAEILALMTYVGVCELRAVDQTYCENRWALALPAIALVGQSAATYFMDNGRSGSAGGSVPSGSGPPAPVAQARVRTARSPSPAPDPPPTPGRRTPAKKATATTRTSKRGEG